MTYLNRCWGIRHLRYFILRRRVERWAAMWGRCGIGLGFMNESDARVLDAIWRGEM